MLIIDSFRKPFGWLSNFSKTAITLDGITYPTLEHAFQAAKTDKIEDKAKIAATGNPVIVKRMGKKVKMKENWNEVRLGVMRTLVDLKFQDETLSEKLIATEDATLIEGNHWHDNYWGVCNCKRCSNKEHANHLGVILMEKRDQLKTVA